MNNITNRSDYFPALDGLRGIAIFAVILYHNFPQSKFYFGWLGVDLFFVLSGFLITSILLKSLSTDSTKKYFKNFYIRRALRIFPLYYFFLVIFLFILPSLNILNSEVEEYREDKWWYIFYLQNWLFTNDFPAKSNCLNHFWSLAVEEQFYILWPLTIFLIKKTGRLLLFLSTILLLIFLIRCYLWYIQIPGFNYTNFFTFTRIDGICVGSFVALITNQNKEFLTIYRPIIITGLAVLNFTFFFFNTSGSLPFLAFIGYITFAAVFGVLVYELSHGNNSWLKNIFSFKPLRFIGKISYGLYMFHWPIHYFLNIPFSLFISKIFNFDSPINALFSSIATTLLAIAISSMSYYYFESYFLKLKNKFS